MGGGPAAEESQKVSQRGTPWGGRDLEGRVIPGCTAVGPLLCVADLEGSCLMWMEFREIKKKGHSSIFGSLLHGQEEWFERGKNRGDTSKNQDLGDQEK